jgi:hypothetical protein
MWWNEVKKISGMVPATSNVDIRSQLHIGGIDGKSNKYAADLINTSLLEPMQAYQPLACLPPFDEKSEVLKLDVYSVYSRLLACVAGGIRGHERMGSLKYRLPKNDTF